MKTVNMHDAKTNLSRLVAAAVAGEPFIIARAGKPLVKVEALGQPEAPASRLGFMAGKIEVDDTREEQRAADLRRQAFLDELGGR